MDPSCGIGRASGFMHGVKGHVCDDVNCQVAKVSTDPYPSKFTPDESKIGY
jgi:hypothetical protein